MSNAFVPYNGTAGWSGTNTSMARAVDNVNSGRELNNQQLALHLLKKAGVNGLTWRELSKATEMHHGTASGVLSVLHKEGAAARRTLTRMRCKIYIHTSRLQRFSYCRTICNQTKTLSALRQRHQRIAVTYAKMGQLVGGRFWLSPCPTPTSI
jgi:hypothetical protein